MSSLTSRLKMLVPDTGDLADPAIYYSPAISILETEIPGAVKTNRSATPDYDGQIQMSSGDGWSRLAANGHSGKWKNICNFNTEAWDWTQDFPATGNSGTATFSGSETFASSGLGFSPTNTALLFKQDVVYDCNYQFKVTRTTPGAVTGFVNVLFGTGSSVSPPNTGRNYKIPVSIPASDQDSVIIQGNFTMTQLAGTPYSSFGVWPSSTLGSFLIASGFSSAFKSRTSWILFGAAPR